MDTFGRIIMILLAVVLLVLFPLRYISMNQDNILKKQIWNETVKFTEDILGKGYLSAEEYTNYLDKINESGQIWKVDIIHSRKIISSTEDSKATNRTVDDFSSITYIDCIYMDTICKLLDQDGVYNFNLGDYITVSVSLMGNSIFDKLYNLFVHLNRENTRSSYGGQVHG